MIQRIQTLLLLIALAAFAACFFLPFWLYVGTDYTYRIGLFAVTCIDGTSQNMYVGTMPIIVLTSVSALLAIVSIFLYKNRKLQIRINNYNLLLTVIFIGTIFLWIPHMISEQLPTAIRQWQPGLIFPVIAIIFLVLSNIFINKDEKLVKSTDRLR